MPTNTEADDLPYRIVEEMGFGLTFRSCTCGQLPCARLRPIRDALEAVRRDAATRMRGLYVAKVKDAISDLSRTSIAAEQNAREIDVLIKVREDLESLTLDQVEQEKQ